MSRYNLYVNRQGRIQKKEYFNDRSMAWVWTNTYKEDPHGVTAAMYDTQENLWYVPGISEYVPKDMSKIANYILRSAPEAAVDPLIRAYALLN